MKTVYPKIVFLITLFFVCNLFAQDPQTNAWSPNTELLDKAARDDFESVFARDVKNFYRLLHEKKWKETYELRAKAFRNHVTEDTYISEVKKYEKIWGLVNYEVLSIKFQASMGSTNFDTAVLICKFIELPDNAVSYSTVYWHYEEGVWKCLSAGPSKLSGFRATRPVLIDWD